MSNVGETMTASTPLAVLDSDSFVLKRPERPPPNSETFMRASRVRFAVSRSLATLVGCGGGSQMGGGNGGIGQTIPPPTSFAESWHFSPSSGSPGIEAALTLSPGSVVGVAHFQSFGTSRPCPTFFDDLPLSGTIDAQGNLSVKSSSASGPLARQRGSTPSPPSTTNDQQRAQPPLHRR